MTILYTATTRPGFSFVTLVHSVTTGHDVCFVNVNATHTHIYIYILLRFWTRIVWTRNAGAGFSSTTKRPAGSWAYCHSSKVYPCA